MFLGGLGGSPYPLMRPTGRPSCDIFVTGGVANRAAVAAGVRHGGGGDLTWSAHPSSGFRGVGVDIVLGKWHGSEVGSWGPRYEDPGSLEKVSDFLDVGNSE